MQNFNSFFCVHRFSSFKDFYCDPLHNLSCEGCRSFFERIIVLPRPNKIYLFGYNSMADQITILNFLYPNKVLFVSQDWYRHMFEYGYSSDCAFICEISKFRHTPLIPQLLSDSGLFV